MENVYRFMQAIKDLNASTAENIATCESVQGGDAWLMVTTALVDQERRLAKLEADLAHTVAQSQRAPNLNGGWWPINNA